MKGIYILSIAIILIIILGVLFYYEDINFHVIITPFSTTYVNQQNGGYIIKLNVTAINDGFLPMNLNLNVEVQANLASTSSLIGGEKTYSNTTTIYVGPFGKKSVIITYYMPLKLRFISSIILTGNGYYNYKVTQEGTTSLINELNHMISNVSSYINYHITLKYDNITLKQSGASPFPVYPIYITIYSNGSISSSWYLFIYPSLLNIKSGTYALQIKTNSSTVYNSTVSIPYSGNYIFAHILSTPPMNKDSEYIANVTVILKNNAETYLTMFTISIYPFQ
ncbi:hypothetical protein SJAV_23090 [Sulfurisphaera javensis]|uniref:CARDB domain-containing protein n=1 Tax=Sulfurisphaera javensis TaxID=2049879 RepID=A0AAT9GU60_9CREN